jgi:hypothetical protein
MSFDQAKTKQSGMVGVYFNEFSGEQIQKVFPSIGNFHITYFLMFA